MTLDELRKALDSGTLDGSSTLRLERAALTGDRPRSGAEYALYRISCDRARGPRMMLPRANMPVLP